MLKRLSALAVLAAGLLPLAGGARAADKQAEEQFAKLIHAAVVARMPRQHEDKSNWGKTVPIMEGVKLANVRTKVKVGDHEEWPDGAWDRVVFRVDDPDKDITIKVSDVRPSDHKTMLMKVEATAKVRVEEEHKQWQKGLQILAFTAEANAVVTITLDVDAAVSLDRTKVPPEIVVKPTVTKSELALKEFELVRVGKVLEGERARQAGDELKGVLQKSMKLAEPLATQQINEAIGKALKENKGPLSGEGLLKEE